VKLNKISIKLHKMSSLLLLFLLWYTLACAWNQ